MANRIMKFIFVIAGGLPMANHLPAQVIYSGPRNQVIDAAQELSPPYNIQTAPNIFKIDFNLDGKPDIGFLRSTTSQVSSIGIARFNQASYSFYPGVHVPSGKGVDFLDSPWWKGDRIDPAVHWFGEDLFPTILNGGSEAIPNPPGTGFFDSTGGYIGVRFTATDGIHYGWIQYASDTTGSRGIVYDWAWEATPNTPITAGDVGVTAVPEPSTYAIAGVMALGLLAAYRRRRA